jgi:hypothetical protein
MLNQKDLEVLGERLSKVARNNGLKALTSDQAKTLSVYEDWKDGADWPVVIDLWQSTLPESAKKRLSNFYGYEE